jgi:hypothetical protein
MKIYFIYSHVDFLSGKDFTFLINNWDLEQHQLYQLSKDAPTLRRNHLLDLQKAAEEKGDLARAAVILEILTREQEQKKWHRINHTTRPPRGGAPITLQVQARNTINTYSTEHEMFEHTSDHLSQRFRLAHSAPCYRGQLFDDLGFMGDTECAQMILNGTYKYPPDTDKWTKKILQKAHITFSHLSGTEIETMITTEDFQKYWKRVDDLSAESRFLIIKQQPTIQCSRQCMRRTSQHAQGRHSPEVVGSWTDGSS